MRDRVGGAAVMRPVTDWRWQACVRCGMCLSACPTYVELGTEMDSPRGRIHFMRAFREGRQPASREVVRHLDLCLGCRACETACPSGVRYGELLDAARADLARVGAGGRGRRWWHAAVREILSQPTRLRRLVGVARLLQSLRLWGAVRRLVPFAALLPDLPPAEAVAEDHRPAGVTCARVGLMIGCVAGEVLPGIARAAIRVLTLHDIAVFVPQGVSCCGALHAGGGDPDRAREFARRTIDAFPADLEAIVVTGAGCGTTMKSYGRLLVGDAVYAARAADFAGRVRDISEFVAALPGRKPVRAWPVRVVLHEACQLTHAQGIRAAPRNLLAAIPGMQVVELSEGDTCCGGAGTYPLTEPAMAVRLRERKMDRIAASRASIVAAVDPGCLLQIAAGARARGLAVRVAHPVELLAEAYAEDR